MLWDLARDQRLGCYEKHGLSLLSHSVEWSNMEAPGSGESSGSHWEKRASWQRYGGWLRNPAPPWISWMVETLEIIGLTTYQLVQDFATIHSMVDMALFHDMMIATFVASLRVVGYGDFHSNGGTPIAGCFTMENPEDLGVQRNR